MCLIVIALDRSVHYPLLLAANRDEQHARPAQAAAWWPDSPGVLGGRDLRAGGTWLAVDRLSRAAAVTNVRDARPVPAARSRGALVTDFLASARSARDYALGAGQAGAQFGAFNLLVYDGSELHYASNRAPSVKLGPGVHAFSNAPRELEWPKTASARTGVERLLDHAAPLEALFDVLGQRSDSSSAEERYRTAHFVVGPVYGTRCSTVLLLDAAGQVTFAERSFDATGRPIGEVRETFAIERG